LKAVDQTKDFLRALKSDPGAVLKALVEQAIEDPHVLLDYLGMVPIVGEVFDVANGLWYMAEGRYGDAS
jgi:hypothetical protein